MARTLTSRVSKAPLTRKGKLVSTKNHQFESFTQRIARLKIDPISKSRRHEIEQDDLATTTSHFGAALTEWSELNLSESFTHFAQEVEPLCESLPQILHHQDKIMDIIMKYMEKREALSLEPLLSLLSHLARDLGPRFEKHFERALSTITDIAVSHADVEVIEWSFNCLAWLFKYLSRLLVPNLVPTYDIVAPLLGKSHQKPHIARFAAETLSYLLRKAALAFHRDKEPLSRVVLHSLKDLYGYCDSTQAQLYRYGLMTLYSGSIKGVNDGLHSCGTTIFRCLLESEIAMGSADISLGVLVNVIHHTTAETFAPILKTLIDVSNTNEPNDNRSNIQAHCNTFFLVAGTRKGSRVDDWNLLVDGLCALQRTVSAQEELRCDVDLALEKSAAVIFQYAPLDISITQIGHFLDSFAATTPYSKLLRFCLYFGSLGKEKFQGLVISRRSVRQMIDSGWQAHELELLEFLLQLPDLETLQKGGRDIVGTLITTQWLENIIQQIEKWDTIREKIFLFNAYLELLAISSKVEDYEPRITAALSRGISKELIDRNGPSEDATRLAAGRALALLLQLKPATDQTEINWEQALRTHGQILQMPLCLENMCQVFEKGELSHPTSAFLTEQMCRNLSSPSKELRKASLRLLDALHSKSMGDGAEVLQTALALEETPLNVQSVRSISLYIRRMPGFFRKCEEGLWVRKMVSNFLFGLLTVSLTPVWNDAVDAMKEICNMSEGERVVSELAFLWLNQPASEDSEEIIAEEPIPKTRMNSQANEFQCTNVETLQAQFEENAACITEPERLLTQRFRLAHANKSISIRQFRTQALKVFGGIPWIAEKRSRELIPHFLHWMTQDNALKDSGDQAQAKTEPSVCQTAEADPPTKQEKKGFLELLGSFTNPRVLYNSNRVFDTLLKVLTIGDVGMQKLALKAIFTWKIKGVKPYEEKLMNILDDARFREELTIFLQMDNEEGLQQEHKAELMPVLLRLLYGRVTAKRGASTEKTSQAVRRRAVFESLSNFTNDDISDFLSIALGPLDELTGLAEGFRSPIIIGQRQQLGLLNMIRDMEEVFGYRLTFLAPKLASAVLYCARSSLSSKDETANHADELSSQDSLSKDIRSTCLRCLDLLYGRCSSAELQPYVPFIFEYLITPRLEKLPVETAQSVSGLLRLFSTWASSDMYARYLPELEPCLLKKVADVLNVRSAKDEVKIYVINDIFKPLIKLNQKLDDPTSDLSSALTAANLHPHVAYALGCTGELLEGSPSKTLLAAAIDLVCLISTLVSGLQQIHRLLEISGFLLNQPTSRVPMKVKMDLLRIVEHWLPSASISREDELFSMLFSAISTMFRYVQDRDGRLQLCLTLDALARVDTSLREVTQTCKDLNSFSSKSVDDPDFELRLKAFGRVNESLYEGLSEFQWTPVAFNFLFYVRDEEELAVRSSASFGLRRLIEVSALNEGSTDTGAPKWSLVRESLLKQLREGASVPSELVRVEYLAAMACLIRSYPLWSETKDMTSLLVNDDDEASFFSNILHIQQHRRLRSLRRLASEAANGTIRATNIAHFFIPLLEHFVFNRAESESAHNLAAETISSIGSLAQGLEWPQLRALFRRYVSYISTKPELEKNIIRLIGLLIDAISSASKIKEEAFELMKHHGSGGHNEGEGHTKLIDQRTSMSITMPGQEKLSDDLLKNILPGLLSYLHNKDDSTVSLRVPVAVSAVKLLKILPEQTRIERLAPLLTDVCHILRSRAQESRDMTRKTLAEISMLLGPDYFGFVLKELRSTLARGYQLHVLSFTVHSILVATSDTYNPGQLDYCLPQLVAVIMDDIFGVVGQEKDAEDYISKMKEVKSSKSFDSMELLAKISSISHISAIIKPLQSLLSEKLDLRTVKKVDELLRRIGQGLLRNGSVESHEILVVCYEIIQEAYKRARQPRMDTSDPRNKRFLINTKGAKAEVSNSSTTSFSYKLTRFAFDLLRMILRRYESLKTPANLSGFIPAVGDALLEAHEEVQMAALRFIAEIVNVNMADMERNAPVYVSEAVKLIKNAASSSTEVSQAALKLVSAVLREKTKATVKDLDIAFLLKKLQPDLNEPDRQGATFNFLKAVLYRKILVPEVYEIMDSVAAMMITSHSKTTRDMARGVYFEFLMNYPHTKNRVSKQVDFLAQNLDYQHVEGRQSVMEAIHRLVTKAPPDLMQSFGEKLFVALVLTMINDDSIECRKMAGALLESIIKKSADEQLQNMVNLMRTWLTQDDQPLLIRASLQLYGALVEANTKRVEKELTMLQARTVELLETRVHSKGSTEWELLYHTLQLLSKLVAAFPDTLLTQKAQSVWASIRECAFYPHAWVKFAASKVLGLYFADIARGNTDLTALKRPLTGLHGITLNDSEMMRLASASLNSLKVPGIGEELATQMARNLVFLAQFMPLNHINQSNDDETEDSESEASDQEVLAQEKAQKPPAGYIFRKLAVILRREPIDNKAPALISKTTALQITASLTNKLPPAVIQPCVQTILLPMLHFTDPSFTVPFSTDEEFKETFNSIVSSSHEVLGILQKRIGTSLYVQEVATAQNIIKGRRHERRVKRKLDAVADPDKVTKQKRRKAEREKLRRKEKVAEFRGRRRGW